MLTRDLLFVYASFKQNDHRYYKRHGLYDYPHKDWRLWLRKAKLGLVFRLPFIQERIRRGATKKLTGPYSHLLR